MSFWEDRRAPQEHLGEVEYPMFQWFNGIGNVTKGMNQVVATGGFEFPAKSFRGIAGDKMEIIMFPHGSGGSKQEPGYALKSIEFCVVNMVTAWVVKDGKKWDYYPFDSGYKPGAKSQTKLIGFVRELNEISGRFIPVVLTVSGIASKDMTSKSLESPGVLAKFRMEVLNAASGIAGYQMPHYALYVPMKAGKRELVGSNEQSMATRVEPAWSIGENASDDIESIAVPDELFEYIRDMFFDEAKRWAKNLKKSMFKNTDEQKPEDVSFDDDAPAYGSEAFEFNVTPPQYFSKPEFAISWAVDEGAANGVQLFSAQKHAENAYSKVRAQMLEESPDGESKRGTATRIRNAWVEYITVKLIEKINESIPL